MKDGTRGLIGTWKWVCLVFALILQCTAISLKAEMVSVSGGGRISQVDVQNGHREVLTGLTLPIPGFVAVDPVTGDLFTADQDDQAVYRVNKDTGLPLMISGPGVGSGPTLSHLVYGIAVETNGAPVVVDDGNLLGVVRVDPHTGNRVVLSAGSNSTVPSGSGPNFQKPFGIVIESTGNLLVTDYSKNAIVRVDRVTGNRSIVSGDPFGDNVGSGPDMSGPEGITLGSDGTIYVSDSIGLFHVNPTNGVRTYVIYTPYSDSTPPFHGLAMQTNGIIVAPKATFPPYIRRGAGRIVGIDPITPSYTFISYTEADPRFCLGYCRGSGTNLYQLVGVAVDKNAQIIVTDVFLRSLLIVDPTTGDRTILPNSRRGTGIELYANTGIAVGNNHIMAIADDGDSGVDEFGHSNRQPLLIQVDTTTGNRSILSAGSNTSAPRGSGSNFDHPKGVAFESAATFVVADSGSGNPKLVRVDSLSGNRTVLSSSSQGTGTNLIAPYAVAVKTNGLIVVSDTGLAAVFQVDPVTGNRTLLSGAGSGSGPVFSQPRGVTVLVDGTIAVADAALNAVILVNGTTGERVVLSSPSVGSGTNLSSPTGIVETGDGNLLVLDGTASLFAVNRTSGNRTVVSSVDVGSGPSIETPQEFLVIMPPAPSIAVSGNLAFGSLVVGSSAQGTLTISNAGTLSLNVSGVSYPSGFSGTVSGALPAGSSTNVTVTFAPVAATNYSGTIIVNSDATSGNNAISATGIGTPPPVPTRIVGVSGNLVFGNLLVGTTAQQTLTIANTGNTALTVSGITYPAGFSGVFSGSVAPSSSTNVAVTFAPVAAISYSGTVTVNSDKTSGINTIAASGTGIIAPTITTSSPLPSGTVGSAYSTTLAATSGTTPYTWSVTAGSLPVGLSLVTSSGAITGTPTVAGVANFTARVTSANTLFSEKSFSLAVGAVNIVSPPSLSNELATVNGVAVGIAGEPLLFDVGVSIGGGGTATYLWDFGDGSTSTNAMPTHAFANCGTQNVTVTINDGIAPTTTGFVFSVACAFTELPKPTSLKMKSNFAPGKLDTAALKTSVDMPAGFSAPNTAVTLELAGIEIPFVLNAKGQAINGSSSIKLSHKSGSTLWQVSAKLKGDYDAVWQDAGLTNATVTAVPIDVPVLLLFDAPAPESFYIEKPLLYKATAGKSGTAR